MDTGRYLARLIRTLALLSVFVLICGDVPVVRAQPAPPRLTAAVNDFASLVDPASEAELERRIRALMQATGDVIVVATVPSYEGYLDVRELAVKLFENGGRGIGEKGKDNGLLIVVAAKERRAAIEVGYDLESIVTDGFAGETIRDAMIPAFRQGQYGPGLVAAVAKLSSRIAAARGRTTENAPQPAERRSRFPLPPGLIFLLLLLLIIFINGRARRSRRNRWTRGPWSGWSGGVGPFGGGAFGGGFGGFGGGGFGGSGGGGFGGFGGGRSGGGGAAGGW